MSSDGSARPAQLPAKSPRSLFAPIWRKKPSSPVLELQHPLLPVLGPKTGISPFMRPIEVLPPLPQSAWECSFSPIMSQGSPPLSSVSTPSSLPALTRSSTRETLFIKALPPTPVSSTPQTLKAGRILGRRATPHRGPRIKIRPQSSDLVPSLALAHKVDAGQLPLKALREQQRCRRRRSSMPNLADLAMVAAAALDSTMLAPAPSPTPFLTHASFQSVPVTPSEIHADPMIDISAQRLGTAPESIVTDGLGIVTEELGPLPTFGSPTSSSIYSSDGVCPTPNNTYDESALDERSRALEALEGRSPRFHRTLSDDVDLQHLQNSPPFAPSYHFQRSYFSANSTSSLPLPKSAMQVYTAENGSPSVVEMTDNSIAIDVGDDAGAVDLATAIQTMRGLQIEVGRLKAQVKALEAKINTS